ncbi:MAG: YidC/Oxa1 family membrane protein insertase [Firmicutes bacterium]|nr:YidC/Oxa1 family membrane protein insertase [Bacillota bacterium]
MYGQQVAFLAKQTVSLKDGIIVGPIARVIGFLINILFNFVHMITGDPNSLGITIIFLTILMRIIMIPLSYKQQKSTAKMQELAPEIKKIQEKYKDSSKDPEIQRKMTVEIQKLYADNNYNQFAGCLPILIQLPIFMGLYYVMRNPFRYVDYIQEVYYGISDIALGMTKNSPDVLELITNFGQNCGIKAGTQYTSDIFSRILNVLSPNEIASLKEMVNSVNFNELLEKKATIESFLGLNLTETVGIKPNLTLLIPILSGGTTFLSSFLMQRRTKAMETDSMMKSQQRVMMITMPLFMAWITTTLPAGIGLYWITSNVCMIVQQELLSAYLDKHPEKLGTANSQEKAKQKNIELYKKQKEKEKSKKK